MLCPSCDRENASDRVECAYCDALLVDVFESTESNDEKTDPIGLFGTPPSHRTTETESGFTRLTSDIQYSGDLPRLFRFGNRYQVLEKLGEGGMGRVYKALDLELDRPIALKTIRAEKGRGSDVLKRFKQELILARKVTHKNVVRIYDLGEADGLKFFTMELVEGESLRDILREKKKLSVKEALSFLKQMLSGLAEAHGQGIVHRDLKPQNIMVDREGVLRIMDFGIARSADTATLTGTGEMMGTPDYISPEQVKGESATAQSDLYSTGVILYEFLTGEVPFKGETPISKVVARVQVSPTPPRTLNPEIPSYLERIVLKLMEVDPDLRYRTAQEVLQDLEREQVDRSLLLRTRKYLRKHRGWVAAASLAGLLAVGFTYVRWLPGGSAHADVPITTVAILPFDNNTGNPDLTWLETGLPEMLITDISQSPTVRPLLPERIHRILESLGKTGQTEFDSETLNVIQRMAAAQYVIYGSIFDDKDTLRVDLTLRDESGISTRTRVNGPAEEVFSLVDAMTAKLSDTLEIGSFWDANLPISEVSTDKIAAYRAYQQGLRDLQGGRNQAAVQSLQQAVTADPNFAMAHAKLAEAHWNLGESAGAKRSIQSASSLERERLLPLAERYQIYAIAARISDDLDTALDAYSKLSSYYPDDPDISLSLARAQESKGDFTTALGTYKSIVDANPNYGAALLGLGRTLVSTDRSQDAIPVLERAETAGQFETDFESLGMLHSILGVAYRSLNEYSKALEHFQISLQARRRANDTQGVVGSLVNIGIARRKLRQFDEASASLEEAVALAKDARIPSMESAALLNLGNLALETGHLEEALRNYRASLDLEWDLNQQNEIVYRLDAIADVYRLSGRYVDALVYLEEARSRLELLDEPAERAFNLSILGHVKRARGDYAEAAEALLLAIPPLEQAGRIRDLGSARQALAAIYMEQGRFAEAWQVIEQGTTLFQNALGSDLAAVKVQRADLMISMGDYAGAEEELLSVASLVPVLDFEGRPYYNFVRGRWMAARHIPEAEAYLESAAAEGRKGGDALLAGEATIALGRFYMENGSPDDARRALESTLEESSRLRHRAVEAAARLAIGDLEHASGNTEAAERLYHDAIRVAESFEGRPIMTAASRELAWVCRLRGNEDGAEEAHTNATKLVDWMVDHVPPEHVASFRALWRP